MSEKGGPKNDTQKGPPTNPQTNYFETKTRWPSGMCGPCLALEFRNSGIWFCTPCSLERGRRIAPRIPPGLGRRIVPKSIRIVSLELKSHHKSTQIDPKSIRMAPKTLLGCRSRPGRPQGATDRNPYHPLGDFWGDPGRSKGRFWDPWKTEKGSQTDLASVGRHFGEPKRTKSALQKGSRKCIKNRSPND